MSNFRGFICGLWGSQCSAQSPKRVCKQYVVSQEGVQRARGIHEHPVRVQGDSTHSRGAWIKVLPGFMPLPLLP